MDFNTFSNKKIKNNPTILGLNLYAHRELRKPKLSGLNLYAHSELRNKLEGTIKETSRSTISESIITNDTDLIRLSKKALRVVYPDKINDLNVIYHDIHDHKDIKINTLSKEQKQGITHFTSGESNDVVGSSKNINGYLRNKAAGDDLGSSFKGEGFLSKRINRNTCEVINTTEDDVKTAIEILSSCFTPENTIRKQVDTFCGIPSSIGKQLKKYEPNSITYLHSFTSTSTNFRTARAFARSYKDFDHKNFYIIHFICEPGSGLSVAAHSSYDENEIILRYGTKIQYLGVYDTIYKTTTYSDEIQTFFIFKAFPISEARDISNYGNYHHPKGL